MSEAAPARPQKTETKEKTTAYICTARLREDPNQSKTVTVEALSQEAAVQKLMGQGYMVTAIKTVGGKGGPKGKRGMGGGGSNAFSMQLFAGISKRELIFFAIQLSTLLKAGIPLLKSFDIVHRGLTNPHFAKILQNIKTKVGGGASFSVVLRDYPKEFPWIWSNLVEVGEMTGKLPACLEEIALYQESSERIKSKVITAFFYPTILTVAVVGALVFLLLVIVPKFQAIFEAQGMTLPVITQIVVGASNMLKTQFPLVAGSVVAIVLGIAYTRKIPAFRAAYDRYSLGMPVFGPVFQRVAVVRFTRSLGTLLRSGVQILQALDISGRLVENKFIEGGLEDVARSVKSGQGLGVQLESRKMFPVFMTQLITVGEESGQLDRFLDLLAKYYEDQVDTFLARLTTMIEPIMLIVMGLVIGTVVISMFLPIIELATSGQMG